MLSNKGDGHLMKKMVQTIDSSSGKGTALVSQNRLSAYVATDSMKLHVPAQLKNKRCRKCNKLGHFEIVCQGKTLAEENMTSDCMERSENVFFLGSMLKATPDVIEQPDSDNEWLVELHVNGTPVKF